MVAYIEFMNAHPQIMSISPKPLSEFNHSELLLTIGLNADKQAFTHLFEYFAPRLKSFLMKQGTSDIQAEELVQETMLNIWRKSKQFDPQKASASTWIYTIARNLKIDAFRRNKRPTINIDDVAEPEDNSDGADKKVDISHRQKRVASALEMLPPEQFKVVQMSFFEDKSHGEISVELGIPLGTVKSRMRLAFERIRNFVGETV